MATLVPQPELGQVKVSQLQATQRPPETKQGLSDFVAGLLPKIGEGLDAYNKENKDRLIALGASDYMNDYTRDVNILERKNYQQGRDYSQVLSYQTQRRELFIKDRDAMVEAGASEEEIFNANKQYLQDTVNDIYNSSLDSDLKEQLYQETLKENIQYQKLIGEKLHAVALDKYTQSSRLTVADTLLSLQTVPRSAEERVEYIGIQIAKIKQGALSTGFAKTEDEANTAATNAIKGGFDFWFNSIDPKDPNASTSLNQIRDTAESLFLAGQYELASDLVEKVNKAQNDVLSFNGDMLDRELIADFQGYDVGTIDYTPDSIEKKFNDLASTGLYSDKSLNDWYQRYMNKYTQKQEDLLKGESVIDPLSYPDYFQYEYNNDGKGRDKWIGAVVADAAVGATSNTEIANRILARQISSSVFMPELIDRAMEIAGSEIAQWVGMSDDQIKATGGYDTYKANWNGLVTSYQQMQRINPVYAERMISAMDDKQFPNKAILKGLLETGAPLNSAKDALRDPIGTQAQLDLVQKARNSLNLETAKLDRTWTAGHNGTWFNRADEEVTTSLLEGMRTHMQRYQSLIATKMSSGTAANAMDAMERSNLMVSTKYTPVLVDPTTGAKINSGQMRDTKGTPIAKDYFAKVVDTKREAIAKGLHIDPANVLVQQNGQSLYFIAYNKDGNIVNDLSSFGLRGAAYSFASVQADAVKLRDKDSANAHAKRVAVVKNPQFGNIPFGTAAGTSATGDYRNTFVVKKDAVVSNGSVRFHGSNKRQAIKIPANMTTAFGYNVALTNRLLNHWNTVEGYVQGGTYSPSTGSTSKGGNVIGWGIRQDMHGATYRKMQGKSVQEQVNITADFLPQYFRENGLDDNVKRAGLPKPTTAPYPTVYQDAYVLIADSTWHGGGGGGRAAADALNAKDYAEGERIFKASAVYKAIRSDSYRTQYALNTLRAYHNHKTLTGGRGINLGRYGRVNPTGNTVVPYKLK